MKTIRILILFALVMIAGCSQSDVTFVAISDLHIGKTSECTAANYSMVSHLNGLPGKTYPAYRRNLLHMVKHVVQVSDRVLDVGCGTGLGTVAAANKAKEVVALDPSHAMLGKLATKLKRENIANVEMRNGYFPDGLEGLMGE